MDKTNSFVNVMRCHKTKVNDTCIVFCVLMELKFGI